MENHTLIQHESLESNTETPNIVEETIQLYENGKLEYAANVKLF